MGKQRAHQAVTGYAGKYLLTRGYSGHRRLDLRAADGVSLVAWELEGPTDAVATVVIAHGFVNWSRTPRIRAFASWLARDVHVIVPDLRGHGRSGGRTTMGRDEHLDVAAAVAAARPGVPAVTLGVSLGGTAVLVHAARNPRSIVGTFAVSAPASWDDSCGEGARRAQRWVSSSARRAVLAALLRTRVMVSDRPLPDAAELMPRIAPAFTVIVADPDDWYFGREHAERLYGLAFEPRELWWCAGLGHGTDLLTPELARAVVDRIRCHTSRTAPPRGV